ncbi:MAG: ABC transporter permease [Candidatus Zixiibacteriota bacterium]|nr:MAG: ABC transporter permease [candidate division Zixibacteria bacterium]
MLRNFIKVTVRNILKHKGYSAINIVGLAIGLSTFMLIMLFVLGELGYDSFHKNADRVYRIALKFHVGSSRFDVANGPAELGAAMMEDYPEVVAATRLFTADDVFVRYDDKQFREERFLWADSNVFDLFDIKLLAGDPKTALAEVNSVIITPETAEKYFGQEDPLGKMLTFEDGTLYTVTGLAEPLPPNSHFHFDLLGSFASRAESSDPDWDNLIASHNYIMLAEDCWPEEFEAKIPEFCRRRLGPLVEGATGASWDDFLKAGNNLMFFLQPLTDIHLTSHLENEIEPNGSYASVWIFSAIALLILIIAIINFVNLATARASGRANEVGVRKAIGSSRNQLVRQFLAESVFITGIAVILAVLIVANFIPLFNRLLDMNLAMTFLTDWYFVPSLIGLTLLVGITAGIYPAFILSSFQPVRVLKGKSESSKQGRAFRSILVVFQFAASVILFVGTMVIYNQLEYIRGKELGYDHDSVVVICNVENLGSSTEAFKNELTRGGVAVTASYSDGLPEMRLEARVLKKEGDQQGEYHTMLAISADYHFPETYKIELVDGRYFDPARLTDSNTIILNEAAVQSLGLTDPLGTRLEAIDRGGTAVTVIGVVKNFHIESLHEAIRPTALMPLGQGTARYLSIRMAPGDPRESIATIESLWGRFVTNQPAELVFYDDLWLENYAVETRLGRLLSTFAFLAILLACLGLFGLASFTAGRRSREVGIRRVFGASVRDIVLLLSRESAWCVIIANVVALPVSYWAMTRWLESFAYRIEMGVFVFIAAGIAALVIAVLTVSYQAIKAARANPVDSIQYE